jgi:hypothetical protein
MTITSIQTYPPLSIYLTPSLKLYLAMGISPPKIYLEKAKM